MKTNLRILASLLFLGAPLHAQLASYDAGLAGNPATAPDPTTQGWTLNDGGAGNTVLTDVSPDGATGLNAWQVDDSFTDGGSRADYRLLFTPEELQAAASQGWEYSTTMRMLHSNGDDVVFEFASGQGGSDERYIAFFEVSGNDVLANMWLSGISYTCVGAMDGEFHTFTIRRPAGPGVDADFLYDGQLLGPMQVGGSNGGAPSGGVSWGTGSSGGTGGANFHSVEFTLGPPAPLAFVDVFHSGDGYASYRIPSIVTTSAGTVLAFCEGRVVHSDHAQNDIVMRRSTDGGTTWGPMQVLHDDGLNSLNNPQVLQVGEGPHAGRILLMYQRYPYGCHESCVVPGYTDPKICRGFIMHSDDDGVSWSAPLEITQQVKRPTYVTSIAGGPGVGIQKRRDPHAGRLIMPFNQGPWGDWKVYAVYSDDGGDSWVYGEVADDSSTQGMGNEVQMVELIDGSLLLNSRSHAGTSHRKIAHSFDGGETWTPLQDELQLIEPRVMASILRYTDPLDGYHQSRILYAGPHSTSSRVDGTVHLSYDEGVTWPVSKLLYDGAYAYSVLTVLPQDRIGCFFERDGYAHITLARFSLEWLTDGTDCPGMGGTTYCTTSPNSAGPGALMEYTGLPSIAAGNLRLVATGAPAGHFGLFYYGLAQISVPFGEGVRCVGGGGSGIFRILPPILSDPSGTFHLLLDFDSPPLGGSGAGVIEPASTWNFQLWYRDPAGGPSGFNFSDALQIDFCP